MSKTFLSVGAGPGIGLATALRFAQAGYRVVLAARNTQRLESFAAAMSSSGHSAETALVDASDPVAVAALVASVGAELEVLHYNAGVLHYDKEGTLEPRPLEAETFTSLISDTNINITSALTAIQSAIPALSGRGGTILLTGGGLGVQPSGNFLTLSVGKAGIRAMAQALFEPLGQQGIHVATVTVGRLVSPDSPQARDIAEAFWQLHVQDRGNWTLETVYN
jgi:NAD(P)-dependent dehydrogenase (short-subunit alcohol dehydrogenase family)